MHSRTSSIQSPAEDGAAALRGRRGLRTSSPDELLAGATTHQVTLSLPRFRVETGINLHPVLRALGVTTAFTGDADFSGITTAESGQPYNIVDFSGAVGGLFYGTTVSIIDPILGLAPGVSPSSALLPGHPVVNPNGGLNVLDPTKFAIPFITPGTNGVPLGDNMETGFSGGGRNIFRAPFQTRFDMALRKDTKLTERFGLKYELDAFNVFNHASFAAPSNTTQVYSNSVIKANVPFAVTGGPTGNAGGMGVIQSTIGGPRLLQMSLHLTF